MKYLLALLMACCLGVGVSAGFPTGVPATLQTGEPPVAIEGLAAQLAQLRAQKAELAKKEALLVAEIQAQLKAQIEMLAKLGIKIDSLPVPVPPDVPPPLPTDTFIVELKALFPTNPNAIHKAQAATLAAMYRLAAKESLVLTNVTFSDLLAIISAAINGADGLGPEALKPVRERVRVELTKAAPNLDADLIDGVRKAVADVYARAALALEACAK